MEGFTVKYNELTAEQFIELWQAVHWGEGPTLEQTRLAMAHTLFRVSIFDGEKIIAMARTNGDMGLDSKNNSFVSLRHSGSEKRSCRAFGRY